MSLDFSLSAVVLLLILSCIQRSETFSRPTPFKFKAKLRVQRSASQLKTSSSPYKDNVDIQNSKNTNDDNRNNHRSKFRKLNLTWCNKVSCRSSSMIREQIVGEQNQIAFRGSATGQVLFSWELDDTTHNYTYIPRVLLLVKRNDDSLIKVAEKVSLFPPHFICSIHGYLFLLHPSVHTNTGH